MAGRAVLWRWLVEDHRFTLDDSRQLVTIAAANVLVSPAQRELRPLVVIEQRWLPSNAVVTGGAMSRFALGELLAMYILVAVFADRWCGFEVDLDQSGF